MSYKKKTTDLSSVLLEFNKYTIILKSYLGYYYYNKTIVMWLQQFFIAVLVVN